MKNVSANFMNETLWKWCVGSVPCSDVGPGSFLPRQHTKTCPASVPTWHDEKGGRNFVLWEGENILGGGACWQSDGVHLSSSSTHPPRSFPPTTIQKRAQLQCPRDMTRKAGAISIYGRGGNSTLRHSDPMRDPRLAPAGKRNWRD